MTSEQSGDEVASSVEDRAPSPWPSAKKIFFAVPMGYYSMSEEEQLAWCREALAPLFPAE